MKTKSISYIVEKKNSVDSVFWRSVCCADRYFSLEEARDSVRTRGQKLCRYRIVRVTTVATETHRVVKTLKHGGKSA